MCVGWKRVFRPRPSPLSSSRNCVRPHLPYFPLCFPFSRRARTFMSLSLFFHYEIVTGERRVTWCDQRSPRVMFSVFFPFLFYETRNFALLSSIRADPLNYMMRVPFSLMSRLDTMRDNIAILCNIDSIDVSAEKRDIAAATSQDMRDAKRIHGECCQRTRIEN